MSAPTNPLDLFAAQLTQTVLAAIRDAATDPWAVGVVTDVDGSGNATVDWRGTAITPKRLATYTPVVGDVVLMARWRDQLTVHGKIV
jgi:hypothetical protein